jgi:hypothetical protein
MSGGPSGRAAGGARRNTMQPATRKNFDIHLDGHYWQLTMLAEWEHLSRLGAQAGLVWRDADATRHRLLWTRVPRPARDDSPEQLSLFSAKEPR